MIRALALALLLAACGGAARTPAASPTPAAAPAADPANPTDPVAQPENLQPDGPPTSCEDACTEYAVCYEEVYGGDYKGGGQCVSNCEEMSDADRQNYFTCIAASACDKMVSGC